MPIVDVEVVLKPGESLNNDWAPQIADRLGEIFNSPSGGIWVKLRGIPINQYAENRSAQTLFPVFIRVVKSRLQTEAELKSEAESIASAVAEIIGRPKENVHIVYEPAGIGRVAFGGNLLT